MAEENPLVCQNYHFDHFFCFFFFVFFVLSWKIFIDIGMISVLLSVL